MPTVETSVAVAELQLLPALRAATEGTVFIADGFSCRTQAHQLAGVSGVTLAQLLASRIESAKRDDQRLSGATKPREIT